MTRYLLLFPAVILAAVVAVVWAAYDFDPFRNWDEND